MTTMQNILALAVSLALAGCASDNMAWRGSSQADTTGVNTGYQADTTGSNASTYAGLPDNPQVGATDKSRISGHITDADMAFIRDTEAGNQFEISAAQKALLKSNNNQIKDIAQHLSDDHEKANNQLVNLALSKGMPDTSSLNVGQIKMLSQLDSLNGAAFDREYVNQQLAVHKEAIGTFQAAINGADDKDIRDWASATLPTLENHLSMLQNESSALSAQDAGSPANQPSQPAAPSGNNDVAPDSVRPNGM